MKPKPFVALNHLTVPTAIAGLLLVLPRTDACGKTKGPPATAARRRGVSGGLSQRTGIARVLTSKDALPRGPTARPGGDPPRTRDRRPLSLAGGRGLGRDG